MDFLTAAEQWISDNYPEITDDFTQMYQEFRRRNAVNISVVLAMSQLGTYDEFLPFYNSCQRG
jgi:hypothetical protein